VKILLTGASGYIGSRLLLLLAAKNNEVVAFVRNSSRVSIPQNIQSQVTIIEGDFLDADSLKKIPQDCEVCYYLVHSMCQNLKTLESLENQCVQNLIQCLKGFPIPPKVIYLGGLHKEAPLSPHLRSRKNVEKALINSGLTYTIFKSSIIIGNESASFSIINDLVDKLPVMIAPKWVKNKTQPISILDVLHYLTKTLKNDKCDNQVFEIGGKEILSYKNMLEILSAEKGLKRRIYTVPLLTPRLSAYWLYFTTQTNHSLATSLVQSLKGESLCEDKRIDEILPHKCQTFKEAVNSSLKDQKKYNFPSWKDAFITSGFSPYLLSENNKPSKEALKIQAEKIYKGPVTLLWETIISTGSNKGWFYMNFLWEARGFLDKCLGGVGFNRGNNKSEYLQTGDAIGFWRIVKIDPFNHTLLMRSEMKTPGKSWLEIQITKKEEHLCSLKVNATFEPEGNLGKLYWTLDQPVHKYLLKGMAKTITKKAHLYAKMRHYCQTTNS
jgi:uncharacterized protein YbjT (DUF2867 family)